MAAVSGSDERLSRAVARWNLTLVDQYSDVYPGNIVWRCALPDGTPAVVKTKPDRGPEDEFVSGIDAMVLYGGRGMVRVLDLDRDERVVLMEQVVPGQNLLNIPIAAALEAAASVMRNLRRPPPPGHSFADVRAYYRAWPNHLRVYGAPGPIDPDLFEMGARLLLELCDTSVAQVVLHGDLHYGNILSSDREGWLAIDPKGVVGEPCYEVGDMFRNRVDELYDKPDPVRAMRHRIETVATLTAFDPERVRLWALAQAVLSCLWTAEDPRQAVEVDLRAARLLRDVGPID